MWDRIWEEDVMKKLEEENRFGSFFCGVNAVAFHFIFLLKAFAKVPGFDNGSAAGAGWADGGYQEAEVCYSFCFVEEI
jgi:hypothetical protein